MAIKLSPEVTKQLRASIKRYFAEHLELEIGDLKVEMLLDYVMKEIAPSVYNRAILDAQTHIQERLVELEGSLYEPELTFWKPTSRPAGRKTPR